MVCRDVWTSGRRDAGLQATRSYNNSGGGRPGDPPHRFVKMSPRYSLKSIKTTPISKYVVRYFDFIFQTRRNIYHLKKIEEMPSKSSGHVFCKNI